ncbi:hypothetical protein FQZ97_1162920 [compost metagenome]
MTAWRDRGLQPLDIGGAVVRIGQEMKGGPIMPYVVGAFRLPLGHVGGDPVHLIRTRAKPRPGGFECSRREIEHGDRRHALIKQCIDQPRRAATDIDQRRRGNCRMFVDEIERNGRRTLEPADALLTL